MAYYPSQSRLDGAIGTQKPCTSDAVVTNKWTSEDCGDDDPEIVRAIAASSSHMQAQPRYFSPQVQHNPWTSSDDLGKDFGGPILYGTEISCPLESDSSPLQWASSPSPFFGGGLPASYPTNLARPCIDSYSSVQFGLESAEPKTYAKVSPSVSPREKHYEAKNKQRVGAIRRRGVTSGAIKDNCKPNILGTKVKKDAKGNLQHVFRIGLGHRGSLPLKDRAATELTRKWGSCTRCKQQKIRCNSSGGVYDACQTCAALPWARLRHPCTRIEILDLSLHRRGSTTNTDLINWFNAKQQLKDVLLLDDGRAVFQQPIKVRLTQHVGTTLEVTLSTFLASPEDVTAYPWRDSAGMEHLLSMPPYFISDLDEAKANLKLYTRKSTPKYFNKLIANENPIIRETFRQACKHVQSTKSPLLVDALHFWAATRITEILWNFCDDNALGLDRVDNLEAPWYDTIPITPIMDTQLDELAIGEILLPLGEKILISLREKILAKRREDFMEIFLTTFIIMSNFECILADVIDYTERHGMKTSSGGVSLCEGYVHTCKALLTYFHFAADGAIPFQMDWSNPTTFPDYITADQAAYIRRIQQEVQQQQNTLKDWRHESMYKRPLYWCYQLLMNDWKGNVRPSCEILSFTEKDFLTS